MLVKMGESKYGAPAGVYVGPFLSLDEFKGDGKPRMGHDGKPMGPAVEWQFEVGQGPHKGQIIGRITSAKPTAKNSCGVLLQGLVGRPLKPDEEVDVSQYVGKVYQLVVSASKENPEKTYVTQIFPLESAAPSPAPPGPAPPVSPPAPVPPPQPTAIVPPPPANGDQFWVQIPGEPAPQRRDRGWVQSVVNNAKSSEEVDAIKVINIDLSGGWKSPAGFGILPDVPF
jgi:hypothetical protein